MSEVSTVHGTLCLDASARIVIVSARFNQIVVDMLVKGAIETLQRTGIKHQDIVHVRVPGCWELPLVLQTALSSPQNQAAIALGAVIRGATPHFDYVAGNCAQACQQISLQCNKPVGFGVLTTDSVEQSIERAGSKAGNKGSEAALAVIETLSVQRALTQTTL